MELSKRLQAVADLVTAGYITADVGTDHAYVPICLVREGRIPCAIASDVNIGPLERAREHVCENGLEDKIDLRISNGFSAISPGSAVLFGLFHGNLLQTPYAFGVGLLLGYVTVEYSFVWAVVLHLFNNLVLADLLTRLMNVLPVFLQDGLYVLIFGGCFVASLVILGVKAREIREYNRSEWMDRRCLKCFFLNFGVLTLAALMIANMISLLFL